MFFCCCCVIQHSDFYMHTSAYQHQFDFMNSYIVIIDVVIIINVWSIMHILGRHLQALLLIAPNILIYNDCWFASIQTSVTKIDRGLHQSNDLHDIWPIAGQMNVPSHVHITFYSVYFTVNDKFILISRLFNIMWNRSLCDYERNFFSCNLNTMIWNECRRWCRDQNGTGQGVEFPWNRQQPLHFSVIQSHFKTEANPIY